MRLWHQKFRVLSLLKKQLLRKYQPFGRSPCDVGKAKESGSGLICVTGMAARRRLSLVAPYCAIPRRDYLSDTPLLRAMGFCGVSTWPIGCDTPSPFSEHFPLEKHAKWRSDTHPHKRGIAAILARYPMKRKRTRAIPPSAIISWNGIARYGGVSRTGPLSD